MSSRAPQEAKKGSAELVILASSSARRITATRSRGLIEQRSGGGLRFTLASLYATLYRMEDRGWISGRWVEKPGLRRRCYYRITEAGRRCSTSSGPTGAASSRRSASWPGSSTPDRQPPGADHLAIGRSDAVFTRLESAGRPACPRTGAADLPAHTSTSSPRISRTSISNSAASADPKRRRSHGRAGRPDGISAGGGAPLEDPPIRVTRAACRTLRREASPASAATFGSGGGSSGAVRRLPPWRSPRSAWAPAPPPRSSASWTRCCSPAAVPPTGAAGRRSGNRTPRRRCRRERLSPVNFMDYRAVGPAFTDAAAWWRPEVNLAEPGTEPIRISTIETSANLFEVLGVSPQLGAGFPARRPVLLDGSHRGHQRPSLAAALQRRPGDHRPAAQRQRRPVHVVGVMPRAVQFSGRCGYLAAA